MYSLFYDRYNQLETDSFKHNDREPANSITPTQTFNKIAPSSSRDQLKEKGGWFRVQSLRKLLLLEFKDHEALLVRKEELKWRYLTR